VTFTIYSAHHNKAYWQDPYAFTPERFTSESNTNEKNIFAYLPFSAGPRNCIGQKFAMQEAITILSMIIQNFDIEFKDPAIKVKALFLGTLTPKNLFVKFIPLNH